MGKLLMLAPATVSAIAGSGTGNGNLLTPDPKEVWVGGFAGGAGVDTIVIDLGAARAIDTIFLGSLLGSVAGSVWGADIGVAAYGETLLFATDVPLRAPDAVGQFSDVSHAFWTGAPVNARYIRIYTSQPAEAATLMAGNVMVGRSFTATYGQEWGAGRKVIDTGTSTPLPSGGFAVVEGARKGSYSWIFGDLSAAEVDALYALQLDRGETRPLLVVEDPATTPGLRWRLHYGKLVSLRQYERRNPAQTRWELTIEEWI